MKILANDGIAANGKEALEAAGHEVLDIKVAQEQLVSYINDHQIDGLLVRSATKVRKETIDACPGLKLIGRGGVGMDNIDVEYARSKGIEVINTPAASSQSVAELVFSHLYGAVRSLPDSNRNMPLEGETKFNELKKAYSKGTELRGKTIGIVGFGRIGQAVAKIAFGIGMDVVFTDRTAGDVEITLELAQNKQVSLTAKYLSLDELLKTSDFISIHVSGAGQALIGKNEIAKMKKGAGIINTARGGIIDEVALHEALNNDHLAFAGLDVFVDEPTPATQILMNPKISLTPHIGAQTEEAQDRIAIELSERINAFAVQLA